MTLTAEFERFLVSDYARHAAVFGIGGIGATGPDWATNLYRNGQEDAAIDAVAAFTGQPRDVFVGNMGVRTIDPNVTGFDPSRATAMRVEEGRLVPETRGLEVTFGGCLPHGLSTTNLKQILGLRGGSRYKEIGRATTFAMYGALRAISGLPFSWTDLLQKVDPTLIGCSIGCGLGNLDRLGTMFASEFLPAVNPNKEDEIATVRSLYGNPFMDPSRISSKTLAEAIGNSPGGYVAMDLQLEGVLEALTTACAVTGSSVHSLWRSILMGMLRAGFAGGVEAPLSFAAYVGFITNSALIKDQYLKAHNLQPHQAPRPFDLLRDGFVLGEGGAVLFMGDAEWGMSLGLKPLAFVGAVASHGDGYATSATEPGKGIRFCYDDVFRITQLRYGVGINDYDGYGAHGTSTKLNDVNESGHLSRFLGDNGYSGPGVHVFSTQDTEAHRVAGSGGVSMIAGIQSMSSGFFPGLRNLDQPDPAIAAFPHLRIQRDGSRVDTPRALMTGTLGFFHKNVVTSLLNPTVYGPLIFGDDFWKDKERLWREQEEAAARREEDVRTGKIKLATFIPPAPKR